jgi:Alpha-2,8-polysialyltransferase (POLYST)
MTTQVVLASTAFGLATVTAAFDSGAFEPGARRILVITCNTAMPEATTPMQDIAGVPDLMRRFDAVYDYNACIEPHHPSIWRPRLGDLPLWERHFRLIWDLGADDLHLIVESIQVNPAQALCRIFGDARIDLYADGLMSYGPTRTALPEMVASRIERLVHLDLVPGLKPLLLSERHVPPTVISTECFRAVAKSMVADRAAFSDNDRVALIVGQYLAAGRILSEDEELDLYAAMISGCADAGYSSIAFKPHPSAGANKMAQLHEAARSCGVRLEVADQRELAEAWFERAGVELVVGCFSTALLTALHLYGLPVARLGTELILDRLTPFQNSNRIPITLVDALVPDLSWLSQSAKPPRRTPTADLNDLVVAVAYAMQPEQLAARRSETAAFLADHYESHSGYFRRLRLTRLGLPGSLPARPAPQKPTFGRRLRRRVRQARTSLGRWLLGASGSSMGSDNSSAFPSNRREFR